MNGHDDHDVVRAVARVSSLGDLEMVICRNCRVLISERLVGGAPVPSTVAGLQR